MSRIHAEAESTSPGMWWWEGAVRRLSDTAECLCDCADRVAYAHIGSCRQSVGQCQIAQRREIPRTSSAQTGTRSVAAAARRAIVAQVAGRLVAQELFDAARALGQLFESGVGFKSPASATARDTPRMGEDALVEDVRGYFRVNDGAWLRFRCG